MWVSECADIFHQSFSLVVAPYWRAPKRAKQLSVATIPVCFEFFWCRVDVLQSKFSRSTISIAVFCLQNLICLHCYFCWSDPTFFGIFVCGPLQSFMVNVCTMWVSLFFFFKIVKNSHVKTTPLICWPLDRTSKLKLQQKCIKNIICKKSLIKQNIINIRHFKYEKETAPSLLSQRFLGLLLGIGKMD